MFSRISRIFALSSAAPASDVERKEPDRRVAAAAAAVAATSLHTTKDYHTLARRLLGQPDEWPHINWRQFALMHDATIIRYTSFEGGYIGHSISAWRELIALYMKKKGESFITTQLPTRIPLLQTLQDMDELSKLLPNGLSDTLLEKDALKKSALAFQIKLHSILTERSTTYLVLGYRSGVANEGHSLGCKIVQHDGFVMIHFLNLGNGSSPHPVVDLNETHQKISYRFFPIKVLNQVFYGKLGYTALCHMIRYMADPPDPTLEHYTGDDLYDIFLTIGELIPDLGSHPELFASKQQISGDCPEKAVKNILLDLLISHGAVRSEIKKFFLTLQLFSLIAASHQYTSHPSKIHLELLTNATTELGRLYLKLKSFLTKHESALGGSFIHVILKRARAIALEPLPVVRAGAAVTHALTASRNPLPSKFALSLPLPNVTPMSLKAPSQIAQEADLVDFPTFNIKTLGHDLETLVRHAPHCDFYSLYDVILTFPIPEFTEKDLYDELPAEEIERVIALLHALARAALKKLTIAGENEKWKKHISPDPSHHFTPQFLFIHTLYAINDKLARRSERTKLKGFASPFMLIAFTFKPLQFTSLPLAEENRQYTAIESYFLKSFSVDNPKVIFPVDELLHIEDFVIKTQEGSESGQGENHLVYLRQFIDPTALGKLSQSSLDQKSEFYQNLWFSDKLPTEVRSLYYFAFLSFTLFSAPECHFPEELSFSKTTDQGGRRALAVGSRHYFYCNPHHERGRKNMHSQFSEMGIQTRDYKRSREDDKTFIKLWDQDVANLTTNQAVCKRLSEQDARHYYISESQYRDLLRITRTASLALPLAIQWANANLNSLVHPGIEMIIDYCIFRAGSLQKRIKNESHTVQVLRNFIKNGLTFYEHREDVTPYLFFLRTGLCLEREFALTFGTKECEQTLLFYKECLKKKKAHTQQALHLIFLQTMREEISREEFKELVLAYFKVQAIEFTSREIDYPWLLVKAPIFMKKALKKSAALFNDPSFRDFICNALLTHLTGVQKKGTRTWQGEFPNFSSDPFEIHLFQGKLFHKEKGTLHFEPHNYPFWKNDSVTHSADGSWVNNGHSRYYMLTIAGSKRQCLMISTHDDVPRIEGIKKKLTYFSPVQDDGIAKELLGYEDILHEREPFIHFDLQTGVISRLSPQGTILPSRLVNLTDLKPDHPLFKYTLKWAAAEDILCFVYPQSHAICELYFTRLNLQFKARGKELYSIDFETYFLVDEQIDILKSYNGYLVLKNKMGKVKVLLIDAPLSMSREDFSTAIFSQNEGASNYFAYDIDPKDGSFTTDETLDRFYFALLMKMHRRYDIAESMLQKLDIEAFDNAMFYTLLERFIPLKDRSPPSLAFNLKLFSLVISHIHLMKEMNFAGNGYFLHYRVLFSWGLENYIDYFKATSPGNLSSIPDYLRLDEDAERSILTILKRFCTECDIATPHVIAVRDRLLNSTDRRLSPKIHPATLLLRAGALSKLSSPRDCGVLEGGIAAALFTPKKAKQRPLYFIRLDEETFAANFRHFYAKALRAGKEIGSFDLTLLSLLKIKENYYPTLSSLLFYVRHFPHKFSDLLFEPSMKRQAKVQMFKEIANRVVALQQTEEYRHFKESYLDAHATFNYERALTLTLPARGQKKPYVHTQVAQSASPFTPCFQRLFTKESIERRLPDKAPFLDEIHFADASALEKGQLTKFIEGYEALKGKKRLNFTFHPHNLSDGLELLQKMRASLDARQKDLRETIIKNLNSSYRLTSGGLREECFEPIDLTLRKESQQMRLLFPETIMKEVILQDDLTFLKTHRPMMTEAKMLAALSQINEYYHTRILSVMCEEALVLVQKLISNPEISSDRAELAALLDSQFLYDSAEYPEIAFFTLATGKRPRESQITIYKWIFQRLARGENVLYQGPAGGGKTTLLTPLLIFAAKRLGLTPVVGAPQHIYLVDKKNLGSTLTSLDEKLALLEVGLHMKLSNEDLQFILEELHQIHLQKKELIVTPQILYTLRLMYYYAALVEKDEIRVARLSGIQKFFKEKCLLLMDESHSTLDPMTRAIYGTGAFFVLPENESALFLRFMKPLLGLGKAIYTSEGKDIATLSRIKENLQGKPSEKIIHEIRLAMAEHFSKQKEIPADEAEGFFKYWTNPQAPKPKALITWKTTHQEMANHGALTRYFLIDLLPMILSMQTELNHSKSIYSEEDFDTPCRNKLPSTAQFADPYLALALSIKGSFHRGLTMKQMKNLLEFIFEANLREHRETASGSSTYSQQMFSSWLQKTPLSDLKLNDLNINEEAQLKRLYEHLKKQNGVIEYYLIHKTLKQIGLSKEQLTVTPAHLLYGFKHSVIFSATPLSRSIYPKAVQDAFFDLSFESEVALHWCQRQNSQIVYSNDTEEFFKQLSSTSDSAAAAGGRQPWKTALIWNDVGGFFCNDPVNKEVAQKWLKAVPELDGVLFFKNSRSLKVDRDEKICLILRDERVIEFDHETKNMRVTFKKYGLNWDRLKIGTYYDVTHTESVHIMQKEEGLSLIFGGDRLTSSRLIQALMRDRGFLNESAQKIIWVFQIDVAKNIAKSSQGELNGAAIFAWCLKNEAFEMRKRIILAAFQEIGYQIEAPIVERALTLEAKEQMALFEKNAKGFLGHFNHDPYGTLSDHNREIKTEELLWHYARSQYALYDFPLSFDQNATLRAKLARVIQETQAHIESIPSNFNTRLNQEIEQRTQIQSQSNKESMMIQYRPRPFDALAADGKYGFDKLYDPEYLDCVKRTPTSREIFNTSKLTAKLHYENNQLLTALHAGSPLKEKYLKPIDFLLIIIDKKSKEVFAEAVSNEILATYINDLVACPKNIDINHAAFLMTAEGELCQRGCGALAPDEPFMWSLLSTTWIKDLVIDVALLRGQVRHIERFKERLKEWDDFEGFWKEIVAAQPNPESVNTPLITSLLKERREQEDGGEKKEEKHHRE